MYKVYVKHGTPNESYCGSRFTLKDCNEVIDYYEDYFKRTTDNSNKQYLIYRNDKLVKVINKAVQL